jgi:hypothetical protein
MKELIPQEIIEKKIFVIRGQKVMLDKDLAVDRFPEDFMFQLTKEEYSVLLRYQSGTLKRGKYSKYLPYVFTENGVAMLSVF